MWQNTAAIETIHIYLHTTARLSSYSSVTPCARAQNTTIASSLVSTTLGRRPQQSLRSRGAGLPCGVHPSGGVIFCRREADKLGDRGRQAEGARSRGSPRYRVGRIYGPRIAVSCPRVWVGQGQGRGLEIDVENAFHAFRARFFLQPIWCSIETCTPIQARLRGLLAS